MHEKSRWSIIRVLAYLFFSCFSFAFIPSYFQFNSKSVQMQSQSANVASNAPRIPLPPIILSNEPGTWAYDTMSRRVRENILMRIYEENDMTNPKLSNAKVLLDELVSELENPQISLMRPISNDGGTDVDLWNNIIMKPYIGMNWLDAPWLFAEFYVYRRVIEAFSFFSTKHDPFEMQKRLGVTSALFSMEAISARLNKMDFSMVEECLKLFLYTSLWGNRMDLSLWPVSNDSVANSKTDTFAETLSEGQSNLLGNDIERVISILTKSEGLTDDAKRVDIIIDNAGFEIFCDLCLADALVQSGVVDSVVIHLKGHPTFVSDALSKDMLWMIQYFCDIDKQTYPNLKALGDRWKMHIDAHKWILKDDLFWAQPSPFWEMPNRIREELRSSSMIFVKGDANYRRLLGDRKWPLDTLFSDIASYWPAPVCALRTLKAELGCGMNPTLTKLASETDEDWMVSGKYGVIQVFNPNTDL